MAVAINTLMKKILSALGIVLTALLIFIGTSTAFASTVAWSPDTSGTPDNFHIPGSNPIIYVVAVSGGSTSSSDFGTTYGTAHSVTGNLQFMTADYIDYYHATYEFYWTASNHDGSETDTSSTITYVKSTDGWSSGDAFEEADFTGSLPINDLWSLTCHDVTGTFCSGNIGYMTGYDLSTPSIFQGGNPTFGQMIDPSMSLDSDAGSGGSSIALWYGPYSGSSSVDFRNWYIKVNGPALAVLTPKVFLSVTYASVADPSTTYTDASPSWIPFDTASMDSVDQLAIPKATNLTAGDWTATATVYEADDTTVAATTATITFTITSGTATDLPPRPTPDVSDFTATCTSDGSTLGDIKAAFCSTLRDLFVPDSDITNQFQNLPTLLQAHAPFSYFYDIKNCFTDLSPSSSSISGLTLTTGGAIPISVDMFSSTTIDKYTSSGTRGTLRTLIQYSLYLAFVFLVFHEVRKLFRKQ